MQPGLFLWSYLSAYKLSSKYKMTSTTPMITSINPSKAIIPPMVPPTAPPTMPISKPTTSKINPWRSLPSNRCVEAALLCRTEAAFCATFSSLRVTLATAKRCIRFSLRGAAGATMVAAAGTAATTGAAFSFRAGVVATTGATAGVGAGVTVATEGAVATTAFSAAGVVTTVAADAAGTGAATRATPWYDDDLGNIAYSARLQLPKVRAQAATANNLVRGENRCFMNLKKG